MKILLLAGEESGVLYARRIAETVRRLRPDAQIHGYADYGFETGDLAVMGLVAIARRFRFFLHVKRTLEQAIDTWRPDVVCTVDYPGLNLRLAAYAKAHGIRTVHVVCPQVWAWKRGRIPKIEAAIDKLCCFFPFEPDLFKPGFATFVGHPLAEEFAARVAARPSAEDAPLLAVLPGSRLGEISYLMPTLMRVITALRAECPMLRVTLPAAHAKAEKTVRTQLARAGLTDAVTVQTGGARELLFRARAAIVASGTATLEAALARCPTVLVYKVDPLFAAIARRVITGVRHIGLANVIWEKCAGGANLPTDAAPMPELLQENFTPENVLRAIRPLLFDENARRQALQRLDDTMKLLHSGGDAMTQIAQFLV